MKVNLPLLKLIIRLLILLILFVMLFLISAFLYSARYWKDVYNYITPNITIKHIPTVSELNLTDYDVDFTTEIYGTSTEYGEFFTMDEEYFSFINESNVFDDQLLASGPSSKQRRSTAEDVDYDLPNKTTLVDYFFDYDGEERKVGLGSKVFSNKLMKRDLEDVDVFGEINATEPHCTETTDGPNCTCDNRVPNQNQSDVIFPWIAAIFVRNNSSNEFEYICDGAILGERAVLTTARCLGNSTAADVLVLLGKRSLKKMDGNEVYRINATMVHENFSTDGNNTHNDLAMLVPEDPILYNPMIQRACMLRPPVKKEDMLESYTTGWHISGELVDIRLSHSRSDTSCLTQQAVENIFCAAYDNNKKTCPSYGGLHMVKLPSNLWYLDGLLTEDTRKRGICFHKSRTFTDLTQYESWFQAHGITSC